MFLGPVGDYDSIRVVKVGGCKVSHAQVAEIHSIFGYGSIPIDTIFSGMNIHLPAILM